MTVQPKALAVKQVPLDELKHDPNNVRRRDDAAVDAIANSLKRFGQQDPELVDFTAFSSNDIEQMMQGLSPDIGGDDDDDEDDEDKAIPDNSQDPDELSFQLVVTCKGEKDQAKLYEELSSRGYECRILML